jgi:uncharacterized membrane protein YgcG
VRHRSTIRLALLAALLLVRWIPAAQAQRTETEHILDFHSDIRLQDDSSLLVTESIIVYAAGNRIRHGIFREFPTQYKDPYNNRYVVGFQMQSATLDSYAENFRVEPYFNGQRIYLGDPQFVVQPGRHTYTLTYITTRQLGFFRDHDELYWNATGNGWSFPIDHASATVHLLTAIPADRVTFSGFTGPQGSQNVDLTSSRESSAFEFATRHALGPKEGLSVLLMWPKGYVAEPTFSQKRDYFFRDNRDALLLALGFLATMLYYVISWFAVGRDPQPGVILPLYEPPPNLSPAAMRYLVRMGYDNKTFAAAILDMGARGFLKIKQQAGSYTLYATGKGNNGLSPDEKQVASEIFDGRDQLWLHNENHAILQAAQKSLKQWLKTAEEKVYFATNSRYLIAPVLFSFGLFAAALFSHGTPQVFMGFFLCFWLTVWTFAVAGMILTLVKSWSALLHGRKGPIAGIGKCIFTTLFTIPFLAAEVMGLWFLVKATSASLAVFVLAMAVLHILYLYLMKAPTTAGRALLDQVEGFKIFLGEVDGDRLNRMNPPEQTPEVFEKFLPYALALDVEQEWAEKFSGMLAVAGTASSDNAAFAPSFYSSADDAFSGSAFSSSFAESFTSAISSSSSAPGSSGAGGGGGSGGGGGGGGGGGW